MGEVPHVVYLLYGEDEFSITQEIHKMEAKMGDAATAALNTTRLDGRSLSIGELENAIRAMPLLATRRMVILTHPLSKIEKDPSLKKKFIALMDQVPESTALLLVEYSNLYVGKKRQHWLLKWADQAGERVFKRFYPVPKGTRMGEWIREQAVQASGSFEPTAAAMLASLVSDNTRLARLEIEKLVAYAGYDRPVEREDVEAVTALAGQVDIFMLVDALGMQDGRKAMGALRRLLDEQDVGMIFGMIVRQFRLMLQAREIIDRGEGDGGVIKGLKLHPFVAQKISLQARRFSLATLEAVYRRLLDIDQSIKTGQMEADVALETFVADFTAPTFTTQLS